MRKRSFVTDIIRERVISAQRFGTVEADGRLPSARLLAAELDVDPRVVVAAYGGLERDGLVERRPGARGFFVAGHVGHRRAGRASPARREGALANGRGEGGDPRPVEWLAGVLAQAIERDIPVPDFPERAWRATETLRLRAVCVEGNRDQVTWLCRELQEDYGIEATGLEIDELPSGAGASDAGTSDRTHSPRDAASAALPVALRRADLLVTTQAHAAAVQPLAVRLGCACVVVTHREDLTRELERLLTSGPVYFVGTDERFAARLRAFYAGRFEDAHVQPVILDGEDAAATAGAIPPGAAAYVMRTARDRLGGVPPQVRALSTLRAFSRETRLEILRLVVQRNLAAWAALRAGGG